MARKKSVVEKLLGDVKSSLESAPEKAVQSSSKKSKSGSVKSSYEDHPKFAKFKKEGK